MYGSQTVLKLLRLQIYPYDKETKTITLPKDIKKKIYHLLKAGKKVEAVKRVANLTGASLRVSKDYVDTFEK